MLHKRIWLRLRAIGIWAHNCQIGFVRLFRAERTYTPDDSLRSQIVSVIAPNLECVSTRVAALVEMAQRRRIDLATVSMVELVTACLDSLSALNRIEDKADQLLLAADLTLMKSRLLLGTDPEQTDEEDRLRQQALKLQRIQRVAVLMMGRDQLGRDVWPRGEPELEADATVVAKDEVTLIDVIRAYARLRLRDEAETPIEIRRILAMTMAEALKCLGARLEELDGWTELFAWAGQEARRESVSARSQAAASFVAALEIAKQGEVEIRQDSAFGEVRVLRG